MSICVAERCDRKSKLPAARSAGYDCRCPDFGQQAAPFDNEELALAEAFPMEVIDGPHAGTVIGRCRPTT
jgi:hypothetical protein